MTGSREIKTFSREGKPDIASQAPRSKSCSGGTDGAPQPDSFLPFTGRMNQLPFFLLGICTAPTIFPARR